MRADAFGPDDGEIETAPAVLGAEAVGTNHAGNGRELAYVPVDSLHGGVTAGTNVELRRLEDGHLALLAFSSRDGLAAGCGAQQPWVAIPANQVDELRRTVGADITVVDQPLPPELRRDQGGAA